MKSIKNKARVASNRQTKEEKLKLVELAMINGINVSYELANLHRKGLILDSDCIYYLNGELMIPGFNEEDPLPSYNGNGVETEITGYNELMSALIKQNKEDYKVFNTNYKGLWIECYYVDDDYEFELRYVMLNGQDITPIIDFEEVEEKVLNDVVSESQMV